METVKKNSHTLSGKVVSIKMYKTIVVEVLNITRHPIYKKPVRSTRRIKAHNELSDIELGSMVEIKETRPISKLKHFTVAKKLS